MLTLINLIVDLWFEHWQLGLGLKGMGKMMLNIYDYALSLSWTQARTEQGYESP